MTPSMVGKTCLVTGATNGIGEVTARRLAEAGAEVLVHGRNAERGAMTVAAIRAQTGSDKVSFVCADFASLADVRRLAEDVKARAPRLDVLLNNAGAINLKRLTTHDGYELSFGANHLATFLLTNLLLDRLKASGASRIVTVSSSAHWRGALNFEDLNGERGYKGWPAYATSKLCNILFTRSLARRLAGTSVTTNALHPGVVKSNFMRNNFIGAVLMPLSGPFTITPEEGAKTMLYLATSPEVARKSGGFYDKCAPAPISDAAQDDAAGERLWQVSEKMVGLPPTAHPSFEDPTAPR